MFGVVTARSGMPLRGRPNPAGGAGLYKVVDDTAAMPTRIRADAPDLPISADAFRDFVEPHWATMARFARRATGPDTWEDVLQDALTTAWRKRRQYDAAKGTPQSWLLSIVADKVYKRRRRPPRDELALADVGVDTDRTPRLDVRLAVDRLAPRQRIVVTLRYYLALSTEETALVMRCSTGTVKSTLSDARRQLKTILGEDYNDA